MPGKLPAWLQTCRTDLLSNQGSIFQSLKLCIPADNFPFEVTAVVPAGTVSWQVPSLYFNSIVPYGVGCLQ